MKRTLLKGGTVVDPSQNIFAPLDLLIEGTTITALGNDLSVEGAVVVDVQGKIVAPGFIDMHVHLREPGFEGKETIETGCAAAVAGGFTAVACMPNTAPAADNKIILEYIKQRAREVGLARVYPVGAVTEGLNGEKLAPLNELVESGARGISDDGNPIKSARLLRYALEYIRHLNIPLIDHCEDPELAEGMVHEGRVGTALGLPGIPAAAEAIMVSRDVYLAALTGGHVHIAHLSTADALEIIRQAKRKGIPVTAEVTPHHLLLTEEEVDGFNADAKMKPPLRTAEDRKALQEGLRDGTIDIIATDHAPHRSEEKGEGFYTAPFGVIGLETAVGVLLTGLVDRRMLSLERLVEAFSCAPARILNVPGGTLEPGSPADITVLDLKKTWVVDNKTFYSRGRNTPFNGWKLQGAPVLTIVDGEIKMKNGKVIGERSSGF